MRASKALWGWLAVALVGCGRPEPGPQVVTVDLTQIGHARAAQVVVPAETASLPAASLELPSMRSTPLEDARIEASWAQANRAQAATLKREQEVAIQEPLRAFRATQVAEADRRTADRRAELAQDVQAEVDAFSAAVHAHGDEVGWQRVQLAWMAGFPDPDPKSLRKPTGRYGFREVYLDDAARLRTDIHQKDAAFDQEWGKRLATTEARRLRQLEDFRAGLDQDVERATAREEARLRQAIDVRSVQLPLPTPPQAPPDAQLTARRVDFPAASVSRPAISLPAASDPVALAQARLPVFLAQNRYRLAGPGETGKDATGEFLKWLKQFEVGG